MTEIVGGISQNQILAEIQRAMEAPPPQGGAGLMLTEVAGLLRLDARKAREIVMQLLDDGKLSRCDDLLRPNIHGLYVRKRGFQLPSKAKK